MAKKTDPAINPKAPSFSKEDLEAVANELGKVMEFEKRIPTGRKVTIKTLTSDIKEAALELEKEDKISDETMAVLVELEATLPWDVTDEKEKAKAKTQAPPKTQEKKYNRAQAFCDALKGKAKSITEIAEKEMDLYSDAHPSKNQPQLSSIEWVVKDYLQPLVILGFVTEKNKKYSLTE